MKKREWFEANSGKTFLEQGTTDFCKLFVYDGAFVLLYDDKKTNGKKKDIYPDCRGFVLIEDGSCKRYLTKGG